jgi:hypothetical protein
MALRCTLKIDPSVVDRPAPCGGGPWQFALPSPVGGCLATLLDGTAQGPYTLGFTDPARPGAQPIAACPTSLVVDRVQAMSLAELEVPYLVHATLGDQLVEITIAVQFACDAGPALDCHA